MTHRPLRDRNIALAASAIGAAVIFLAPPNPSPALEIFLVLCFSVAFGGAVFGAAMHFRAGALHRLKSPIHQVARWTVDPELWRQFLAWNHQQDGPNHLDLTQKPPFDIIISREAVLIGKDYINIATLLAQPPRTLHVTNSQPAAIVLVTWMPGEYASHLYTLRFPVPPQQIAAAHQAIRAWTKQATPVTIDTRRTRNICLGLMAAGIVCAAAPTIALGGISKTLGSNWGALAALGLALTVLPAAYLLGPYRRGKSEK